MKDYSEELAKIIFDHVKQNKIIDRDYINKVVEVIVNGENLNDYIKRLEIVNYSKMLDSSFSKYGRIFSQYDVHKKVLTLSKTFGDIIIDSYFSKFLPYFYDKTTPEITQYYIHIFFIRTILHEVIHAKQFKSVYEDKRTDLESHILYMSLNNSTMDKLDRNDIISTSIKNILAISILIRYSRYYDYAPEERLADVFSYKQAINISRLLESEDLLLYSQINLEKTLLKGYDKVNCPTLYYLKKFGYNKDILGKIDKKSKKLNLEERLNLGLRISDSEYKTKKLEYAELIKKRGKPVNIIRK